MKNSISLLILSIILIIILSFIFIGCNNPAPHSPKASLTDTIKYEKELSRNLVFTEEFTRENHQYIRFHYSYNHNQSDAVVHNPDCIYCEMNKPIDQIYKEQ